MRSCAKDFRAIAEAWTQDRGHPDQEVRQADGQVQVSIGQAALAGVTVKTVRV